MLNNKFSKRFKAFLSIRVCEDEDCGMYFSTVKSLTEHKRVCVARRRRMTGFGRKRGKGASARDTSLLDMMVIDAVIEEEGEEEASKVDELEVPEETENILDLEESETNPTVGAPSGGIEIIMDLREWLKSPWSSD